ncbi:hypothetical protein DFH08DRAFT_806327 [Mycena albidolilacea]|uniref:Uncharacterized protein n=1 Tax=Mycena albidolilacea TaxID=1033008 RepID=A0AAD7A900_9AGAR|nr:hypothetical protein DFH08DRAFT_806327 [Mycena albidolilacea]
MEEVRTVAAKEAENAEAARKAVLEHVARIEGRQNANDDAYSENADHPPSSDYQELSSDYQEMDDSSEENLKLPNGESMDEADSNYLEDSDVDTDSDEDEGTQTDKGKYKKNPSKPIRQDIERLWSTEDSSGTPKSSAELDTSAAKKRKIDSGDQASHKKKPKMTKKGGLIKAATKTAQRGSEDESMFQYSGPALDNDENEKVEMPVAGKGKKRGLPGFGTIKATTPAPVKHTTQNKYKDSDLPSEAFPWFKGDVVPLACELAGTLEPWLFLTVAQVQAIVDHVFGPGKYLVEKNGPWFELVTYRLTDWCSSFTLQAQKVMDYLVKDAKECATVQNTPDSIEMEDKEPDSKPFDFANAKGIAEFCEFALIEHKPGNKKKSTMAFHWRTYGDGTNKEVECNLGFLKTGEYVVPKGSDWFFLHDNWSNIRKTDPKTVNTLITHHATKYLSTIEKWTAERWEQQLDEAAVWKERKRQKKLQRPPRWKK